MSRWALKLNMLFPEGRCRCWECIRAKGVTPQAAQIHRHPDILGKTYRADTGGPRR